MKKTPEEAIRAGLRRIAGMSSPSGRFAEAALALTSWTPEILARSESICRARQAARRQVEKRRASPAPFQARASAPGWVELTSESYPGQAAIASVRNLPGRSWVPSRKIWRVPYSAAAELLELKGHIVDIPKELEQLLAKALKGEADNLAGNTLEGQPITGLRPGLTLDPHQSSGAWFIKRNERVFLADDQGTGKTVTVLAAIALTRSKRVLVVCPQAMKLQWKTEAEKWLADVGRGVQVLQGRKSGPIWGSIVVANYEILAAWEEALRKSGLEFVCFDEAQAVKHSKPTKSKAARKIGRGSGARYVVLASGTPVENRPYEMVHLLAILSRRRDFGGYLGFTQKYCIVNPHGGFKSEGQNLKELSTLLRAKGIFLRRTKAAARQGIPDKTVEHVPIELSPEAMAEYRAAEEAMRRRIKRARIEKAKAHAQGRDPEGWAVAASMVAAGHLRVAVGNAKAAQAVDFVQALIAAGEKVVVFAHHVELVETLAAELGADAVTGKVSASRKFEMVREFQDSTGPGALVLNHKCGGTGITLTAARHLVMVETPIVPTLARQCEDRIHRRGQERETTIHYLQVPTTIDDIVRDMVARKDRVVRKMTERHGDSVSAAESRLASAIEGLFGEKDN